MQRTDLAEKLVSAATKAERARLLRENRPLADIQLAYQLKEICYTYWTTEPAMARKAARASADLAALLNSPEAAAIADWVEGIAHITLGGLEDAVLLLDRSAIAFRKKGKKYEAAQTGVAKLMALALLGRYDAAIRTGKASLKVFIAEGDEFGAGRVELNLANLYSRLENHRKSEEYGLSARSRFTITRAVEWKIMAENGLAITYANLGHFPKARNFYTDALTAAHDAKMFVTEADLEASLGDLAAMTGNFADAVKFFERSRQKYRAIDMRHNSTVADLEVGASYLQLNLIPEAFEIFARTAPALRKLKLKPEEARARALLGRAALKNGRDRLASRQFEIAANLYAEIGNDVGLALTRLEQSQLELRNRRLENAAELLHLAERPLRDSRNPRHGLLARLTRAKLATILGRRSDARRRFGAVVADAQRLSFFEAAVSALDALGEMAVEDGDVSAAERHFTQAITFLEGTSASLVSDEFKVAFSASTVRPFENLTKILLSKGRIRDAFAVNERSRAQALSEAILHSDPDFYRNNAPADLIAQAKSLREDLNWIYAQQDRGADLPRPQLEKRMRRLERNLASVSRQIGSFADAKKQPGQRSHANLDELIAYCRRMKSAILQFVQLGSSFSLFIVSGSGIEAVENVATEKEIRRSLDEFKFQFASFRYGSKLPAGVETLLSKKTDGILMSLGNKLLGGIRSLKEFDELVIIPAGILNRFPLHALRNSSGYLIQQAEISYAPSTAVWQALRQRKLRKRTNTLVVGYADEAIPFVADELKAVASKTPGPEMLLGTDATFANFMGRLPRYDVVHIACHGQFRPDNPMYSSIRLSDGWVTANDLCATHLKADLVTLSACETGVSEVKGGEEIMGLARGFISAGANSLILSLWTVDDDATRELMTSFYGYLQSRSAGSALRAAQLQMISSGRHPYFWAPFIKIGK